MRNELKLLFLISEKSVVKKLIKTKYALKILINQLAII